MKVEIKSNPRKQVSKILNLGLVLDGMTLEDLVKFLLTDEKFRNLPKDAVFHFSYNERTDILNHYFQYTREETDDEYSKRLLFEADNEFRKLNGWKLSIEDQQRNLQKSLDSVEADIKALQESRKLHTKYLEEQREIYLTSNSKEGSSDQ